MLHKALASISACPAAMAHWAAVFAASCEVGVSLADSAASMGSGCCSWPRHPAAGALEGDALAAIVTEQGEAAVQGADGEDRASSGVRLDARRATNGATTAAALRVYLRGRLRTARVRSTVSFLRTLL